MFDFGVFDGPDGWERYKALRNAMHVRAVDEYFEDLMDNKGNLTKITYGSELKDGTRLSREDTLLWSKRFGVEITERTRKTIDDHFEKMVEELCSKK